MYHIFLSFNNTNDKYERSVTYLACVCMCYDLFAGEISFISITTLTTAMLCDSRPAMARRTTLGTQPPRPEAAGAAGARLEPGSEVGLAGGKVDHQRWQVSAGRPPSATRHRPRAGVESLPRVALFVSSTTTITQYRYERSDRIKYEKIGRRENSRPVSAFTFSSVSWIAIFDRTKARRSRKVYAWIPKKWSWFHRQ